MLSHPDPPLASRQTEPLRKNFDKAQGKQKKPTISK
jgi:hypothetical protein